MSITGYAWGPIFKFERNGTRKTMTGRLPKYVVEYLDRHGRARRYFRYRGKCTAIPYRPGTAQFDARYRRLLHVNGLNDQDAANFERASGFIYFARCGDLIKIGFSSNPKKRVKELQTASANKIEIIHTLPMATYMEERELHRKFASLRVKGEWFSATSELLNYIEQG